MESYPEVVNTFPKRYAIENNIASLYKYVQSLKGYVISCYDIWTAAPVWELNKWIRVRWKDSQSNVGQRRTVFNSTDVEVLVCWVPELAKRSYTKRRIATLLKQKQDSPQTVDGYRWRTTRATIQFWSKDVNGPSNNRLRTFCTFEDNWKLNFSHGTAYNGSQ